MGSQDVKRYSAGSKWLHWVIALIVLVLLSVGFFLEDLTAAIKPTAIMLHKSFGLTVLWLMILRLYWIHRKGKPALPKTLPRWELWLSRVVQYMMYICLIAMAMVGWVMSVLSNHIPLYFGLFSIPIPGLAPNHLWGDFFFQAHQIIAWILIGLIGLHIAGAMKHALIDRDGILQRMLPEE